MRFIIVCHEASRVFSVTIQDTKYSCLSSSQLPWEVKPLITWKFAIVLTSCLLGKKLYLALPICHSHSISFNLKKFWRAMPITFHGVSIDYHEFYSWCSKNKELHFSLPLPHRLLFLFLTPSVSPPHIQAQPWNMLFTLLSLKNFIPFSSSPIHLNCL